MATLIDMARIVTTELGQYDDNSILMAKVYLSKNYITIWDKYLWSDTQIRIPFTLPSGSAAVQIGSEDYPATEHVNHVIMVRARDITTGTADAIDSLSDARMLEPVTSKFLIESAPQIFELGGYLKYYEEWTNPLNGDKFIRFYPTPVTDVQIELLAKVNCPGLAADIDFSFIRNVDPALIAYATHDMLRRLRQYGKAQEEYAKGKELEQVAWNLEQQQANQPRATKATTVAGNSLAEMTDAVCTICGQWTPEYRQIIAEFLRRNYQTLYDNFLWPESLVGVQVPYTTAQIVLPEYIDKVLSVRGNNEWRLSPAEAGLIMDISPEMFTNFGDPVSYMTATPVGVSTLPVSATRLVLSSTSPIDRSEMMLRGEVFATGEHVEENIRLNGTTPVTSYWSCDVPLTVGKDITVGFVNINAATNGVLLGTLLPYQRESKHQRLILAPLVEPVAATTESTTDVPDASGSPYHLLVMGKRAIRPLLTDQDTPIITGAQQVLIAAAASDLFRKMEKHDMANSFQQKASGSMDVLKAKNTDQAAHSPRFVPQIEPRAYVSGGVGGCSW